MTEGNRTRLYVALAGAVAALLFLFVYVLPRSNANRQLEAQINTTMRSQSEILALIPETAKAKNLGQPPQPDVHTWISQNLLGGLERRLVAQNPYKNGAGAEIKLRALTPAEVAAFMGGLATTNLIIKRVVLQDLGSRGAWELELFVETPDPLTPSSSPAEKKPPG